MDTIISLFSNVTETKTTRTIEVPQFYLPALYFEIVLITSK